MATDGDESLYVDIFIYQVSLDSWVVQGRAYIRFCYLQKYKIKDGGAFRKLVYSI